jgi:hypothetical protein
MARLLSIGIACLLLVLFGSGCTNDYGRFRFVPGDAAAAGAAGTTGLDPDSGSTASALTANDDAGVPGSD